MRLILGILFFLSLTSIALGQESEIAKGLLESFPSLGKIMIYMVALQIMLRGLAEGLTRIAVTTESNTDNKIASWISQASWFLGAMLGKFGYAVPKLVIQKEAEKLNEAKK